MKNGGEKRGNGGGTLRTSVRNCMNGQVNHDTDATILANAIHLHL